MNEPSSWIRASTVAAALALGSAPAALGAQGPAPQAAAARPPVPGSPGALATAPAASAPSDARSPFHPHTKAMINQSRRLKAMGYGENALDDGRVVLALNAAKSRLARIEPDFEGHREGAIHELDLALHQIHTRAGKSGAAVAAPVKGPRSAPRPATIKAQAEADAQLREVHKDLVKLEAHMAVGGNVRRLAPARAPLQKAIAELAAGLNIQ